MNISFMRVTGIRSHDPAVLAFADGLRVRWNKHGWDCTCQTWATGEGEDTCPHVEAVAALLDGRVTGEVA